MRLLSAAEALHCLSELGEQTPWGMNLAILKADTLLKAWIELSELDEDWGATEGRDQRACVDMSHGSV